MTIAIRDERPGDEGGIHDLTVAAFAPIPYSDGSETRIIAGLRADGDLAVSQVAVEGDEILGHVAFSPVVVAGCGTGWYGLGPISVRPSRQRQGIGSRLVEEGLSVLRARGATGCVLVGDPDYYRRFGFRSDGSLRYRDIPLEYVQFLSFGAERPAGALTFSPAFER